MKPFELGSFLLAQAEEMVSDIKWAFEDSLKYVSWMDPETKKAAKEKVRKGYSVVCPRGKLFYFNSTKEPKKESTATWCEKASFTIFTCHFSVG